MLHKMSVVEDHVLKCAKLVFEFSITAHATPASKKHASDLDGVCLLATEGKLAEVAAIEDITGLSSYAAPADNSTGDSVFQVMLKGSDLGSIGKVMKVSLSEKTALAASIAVAKLGGNFLTAGGNIVLQVAGTGLNLASESPTFVLEVDYKLSK